LAKKKLKLSDSRLRQRSTATQAIRTQDIDFKGLPKVKYFT
jgi:hypothetical protein